MSSVPRLSCNTRVLRLCCKHTHAAHSVATWSTADIVPRQRPTGPVATRAALGVWLTSVLFYYSRRSAPLSLQPYAPHSVTSCSELN